MKIAGQFLRMMLALPLVLPALALTALFYAIEAFLWYDRAYFHPVSDFIDRVWLDPWNNFIDYGSFRCS